jgi:hypothetical protein
MNIFLVYWILSVISVMLFYTIFFLIPLVRKRETLYEIILEDLEEEGLNLNDKRIYNTLDLFFTIALIIIGCLWFVSIPIMFQLIFKIIISKKS